MDSMDEVATYTRPSAFSRWLSWRCSRNDCRPGREAYPSHPLRRHDGLTGVPAPGLKGMTMMHWIRCHPRTFVYLSVVSLGELILILREMAL